MPFRKEALSDWRKRMKFSQTQAAGKIGVTQVYYSQLENGKRTPSLDILEVIAQVTELNLNQLMDASHPILPSGTEAQRPRA